MIYFRKLYFIFFTLLKRLYRGNRIDDEMKILQAQNALFTIKSQKDINSIKDVELRVFSEWGDDGIIQYLIHNLPISKEFFIEFGTRDYSESNTKFLLINNNWSGLIMDGSEKFINFVKNEYIYYKYDLIAKKAFVTSENINTLLSEEGITGNIGLLHIDIDGNDYWIWKAIDKVFPDIVIVEYNALFGSTRSITTPYKADFYRTDAHHSNLYFGASLHALCDLAEEKGYYFIGCNSNGNNAYFVKKEIVDNSKIKIPVMTAIEGFVDSKFKEARDINGKFTFTRGDNRVDEIRGLPVYNTKNLSIEKL